MAWYLVITYFLILQDILFSGSVELHSQTQIRRNQNLLLNCTTGSALQSFYVTFLANEKTFSILSIKKGLECISVDTRSQCTDDRCKCSDKARWYTVNHPTFSYSGKVIFKCVMQLADGREDYSKIIVDVIDFQGPHITTKPDFPIAGGSIARLSCKVQTPRNDVRILWNCIDLQGEQRVNSSTYTSDITFIALSTYDQKTCRCIVTINGLREITSVTMKVTNTPVLSLDENVYCNKSSTLEVTCIISEETTVYEFLPWQHYFEGFFIREIHGSITNNTSKLSIKSCGYQDQGQYICSTWNNNSGKIFSTNKTATLTIQEPPVIVAVEIIKVLNATRISIKYFSTTLPVVPRWIKNEKVIANTTLSLQSTTRKNIDLTVYNKRINALAFETNITLFRPNLGRYDVILQNDYGTTKKSIDVYNEKEGFKFGILLVGVVSTCILVVIVVLTVAIMDFRNCTEKRNITMTEIYHAAPSVESAVPVYDITDPHYEECVIYDYSDETGNINIAHGSVTEEMQ